MSKYKKQSHVVYKCDYHIVWVPKYRFRILTGEVGKLMDKDIRMYSEWLGCEISELNVRVDHVHVVLSIPPKVSLGSLISKSAVFAKAAWISLLTFILSLMGQSRSKRDIISHTPSNRLYWMPD